MSRVRIKFAMPRVDALRAARAFLDGAASTSLVRRENFLVSGEVYVEVDGEEQDAWNQLEALQIAAGEAMVVEASEGDECLRCGNIAEKPVVTCPACGFVEIAPCPTCHAQVPRNAYATVEGTLHQCPHCQTRVRLTFVDPLYDDDGEFRQPIVDVRAA